MRIGYSYWGFLGDYKEDRDGNELSTPDGNAAYSWAIVWEALRRKHAVFMMQEDRDWHAFRRHGLYDFASFSREKRFSAYLGMERAPSSFPDLDVLLLEWRFPIPGRNTEADRELPDFQPDLKRQTELLLHYSSRGTKVVVWDLDHKLTREDELKWEFDRVIETSVSPRSLYNTRVRVEPPVCTDDLLEHTTIAPNPNRKLVYVGSRYERDDVIDEWIRPVSDRFPGQVHFHGNWEKTLEDCKKRWPNVRYHPRIAMKDFRNAYGDAVACPLLAKRGYLEVGFITPRIWEALIFGTIPVGLASHHGIDQYLPPELIAKDPGDLGDIVERLADLDAAGRHSLRREVAERIRFMDAKHFVDTLELT